MALLRPRTRALVRIISWIRLLSVICAACVCPAHLSASTDVRIVVDVSSVMEQQDPHKLRQTGLEFLNRILPSETTAGVWFYSRHTEQMLKHGPVNQLWQELATIHARNMGVGSDFAELFNALRAATWDWEASERTPTHIVLFSNGRVKSDSKQDPHAARQAFLNEWGAGLRGRKYVLHSVSTDDAGDTALLRQLTQLSGGLHRVVNSPEALTTFLRDINKLMQVQPQADIDLAGRFQVAPDATTLSLLWMSQLDAMPVVIQPDGSRFDRLGPLPAGRWVVGNGFEIVTIEDPQPGWWQVSGLPPAQVSVVGELDVSITGLVSPVVPTDESRINIALYSNGALVEDADFLELLDVRAWVRHGSEKLPMPVDREGSTFVAYFVNLEDGAHEVEIEITAPTFKRFVKRPFIVSNPLQVQIKQELGEAATAWVTFTHPQVDYASIKASAKVRKPPATGKIQPAQKLPGGVYKIPLGEREGILEMSFSIGGNYLNREGFFLKTKAVTVTIPVDAGSDSFRFDAQGKLIEPIVAKLPIEAVADPMPDSAVPVSTAGVPRAQEGAVAQTEPPPLPPVLIPWWFALLIGLVNLSIGGVVFYLYKPRPLGFEIPATEPEPV